MAWFLGYHPPFFAPKLQPKLGQKGRIWGAIRGGLTSEKGLLVFLTYIGILSYFLQAKDLSVVASSARFLKLARLWYYFFKGFLAKEVLGIWQTATLFSFPVWLVVSEKSFDVNLESIPSWNLPPHTPSFYLDVSKNCQVQVFHINCSQLIWGRWCLLPILLHKQTSWFSLYFLCKICFFLLGIFYLYNFSLLSVIFNITLSF